MWCYTLAMLKSYELDSALDAVVAAPDFHRILLENDHVRVLEVVIDPGAREPFHTHVWQSVFVVMGSPALSYFVPEVDQRLFEIPSQTETGVLHLAPEGMHSLENIDTRRLYAFRIEMKHAPAISQLDGAMGPVLEAGSTGKNLELDNEVVRVCLANHLHAHGPILPAVLLRDPTGSVSANWVTTAEQLQSAQEENVVIILKYL